MTLKAEDLNQFTGSDVFYRHPLVPGIVYTQGAKHVADHGGAHWLLDKIATLQALPVIKGEAFQVWTLAVTGSRAVITVEDGNGNQVYREMVDYTDFPMPAVTLWVADRTILLPSEY